MKYPNSRLQVFTRAPVAGAVKTRLQPLLGEAGCAEFHQYLVHHCLDTLIPAQLCPLELWCTPDYTDPFFTACRQQYPLSLHTQTGGDLGQRMHAAITSALQDAAATVLVGTDCPALSVADIDTALRVLQADTDIVLGPARDGGYYLIGMREPCASLFSDIDWSTASVLDTTLTRITSAGRHYHLLEQHDDIDTADDYRRFMNTGGLLQERVETALQSRN